MCASSNNVHSGWIRQYEKVQHFSPPMTDVSPSSFFSLFLWHLSFLNVHFYILSLQLTDFLWEPWRLRHYEIKGSGLLQLAFYFCSFVNHFNHFSKTKSYGIEWNWFLVTRLWPHTMLLTRKRRCSAQTGVGSDDKPVFTHSTSLCEKRCSLIQLNGTTGLAQWC